MKEKSIEFLGVDININEGEKSPIVNITTDDADIYVNGILIWQKYENDEYALIPPILRDFIHRNNPYLEKIEEDQLVLAELDDIENQSSMFLIPFNFKKSIKARVDLIRSMEILESDYIRNAANITDDIADNIIFDLKEIWAELERKVEEFKFKLKYSHSMGEAYYGWWDIKFELKDWNEENFIEIMKIVDKFNKKLRSYEDEYDF